MLFSKNLTLTIIVLIYKFRKIYNNIIYTIKLNTNLLRFYYLIIEKYLSKKKFI